MRRLKFFCLLLVLPCLALQCNKDKDDPDPDNGKGSDKEQLPPATQSGENTFGCLVNGEVWRPENGEVYRNPLRASFGLGRLTISAEREIDKKSLDNEINITMYDNIDDTGYYRLDEYDTDSLRSINYALYRLEKIGCQYSTYYSNKNYVIINRLDSIKNIISGRFEFIAVNDSCGELDTMRVTDGRFDIKYAH
jgi:hypothetical protein